MTIVEKDGSLGVIGRKISCVSTVAIRTTSASHVHGRCKFVVRVSGLDTRSWIVLVENGCLAISRLLGVSIRVTIYLRLV